ncbi:MAG: bifunctional sulfate adenylyltransferase/adenylylsulfate kinase [Desulfatibacillaceae bacterium]
MEEIIEDLYTDTRETERLKAESLNYTSLDLGQRRLCDLELLLDGTFQPLDGFMDRERYESVLETMRLPDGAIFPLPICLDAEASTVESVERGRKIALRDQEGFLLAVMTVSDVWEPDREREARALFGTDDPASHPGVRQFLANVRRFNVGGRVVGVARPEHYAYNELRRDPNETRRFFAKNGWRDVVAYVTPWVMHRRHREMTMEAVRQAGAPLLIQATVGCRDLAREDMYTRVRCYREILREYPDHLVTLGLMPLFVRQAGPREALFHAMLMRTYGCGHFLVTEDYMDPWETTDREPFYPKWAAAELVSAHERELGIDTVRAETMVYVPDLAQYVPESGIPEGAEVKRLPPGELIRRLEYGLALPEWYSYPGVEQEMRRAYPPRHKQGFTVFLTGLSGAGKSTLAKVLYSRFMEMRGRPVTLLDGDIVRRNLSSELTFSDDHRNLNIIRIGFVANEITKNGGIAICAPIAPYESSRLQNRELISRNGGYVEVYLSTPLSVCESRDRKGMYAKCRAGLIKGYTGVDAPYEEPREPELVVDTSELTPEEAAQQILLYLAEEGYIK